jgi:hypothetical protein
MSGNLVPQSERTKTEQREVARQGGIASGKARREKKLMRETLATLLSMPLKDGSTCDMEDIQSVAALKGKNITVQEAIMLAQIQKAMKGDTRAAEFVRDSSGNKPKDDVTISGNINNPFSDLSTEELKKLIGDD